MHRRLGSATLSQLAFPGKGNPNFPWEKSHWDNTCVKKKKKKYEVLYSQLYSSGFEGAVDAFIDCARYAAHTLVALRSALQRWLEGAVDAFIDCTRYAAAR